MFELVAKVRESALFLKQRGSAFQAEDPGHHQRNAFYWVSWNVKLATAGRS